MVDVTPADALLAGDDVRDIEAGRAAGTQTAAIYYGYGSYELDDEVARDSYSIYHPDEIAELVKRQNGSTQK